MIFIWHLYIISQCIVYSIQWHLSDICILYCRAYLSFKKIKLKLSLCVLQWYTKWASYFCQNQCKAALNNLFFTNQTEPHRLRVLWQESVCWVQHRAAENMEFTETFLGTEILLHVSHFLTSFDWRENHANRILR